MKCINRLVVIYFFIFLFGCETKNKDEEVKNELVFLDEEFGIPLLLKIRNSLNHTIASSKSEVDFPVFNITASPIKSQIAFSSSGSPVLDKKGVEELSQTISDINFGFQIPEFVDEIKLYFSCTSGANSAVIKPDERTYSCELTLKKNDSLRWEVSRLR